MLKKMPYSLYRSHYYEYPASDYDEKTKTIMVILPDVKQVRFPKEWVKSGNSYETPSGIRIWFWGTGLAQHFDIEIPERPYYSKHITVEPGIVSRYKVKLLVEQYERAAAL